MRNWGKSGLLLLTILWANESYSCTFCKNASAAAQAGPPANSAPPAAASGNDNPPVIVRLPSKPMGQLIDGYLNVKKPEAEPVSERGTFNFNSTDGTVYGTSSGVGDSSDSSDSDD